MSNMTSESKDIIVSDDCIDSPSFDEASGRGGNMGNNLLKKGPWTIAEDAILVKYVNKYGEGNWSAVQKHYGLSRCGKSCRLRWYNHLRPDLKKGSFTHDEERRIIELHAKMGNKWARIAAELPGRTDNEIKNFWNTRIKKLQRASLPIYPPDAYSHAFEENQQSHNIGSTFSTGLPIYNPNNFDNPVVEFQCFEVNQTFYFDSSENIFGPSSSSCDAILSSSLNGNFSTLGPTPKIELPSLQYLSDFESDDTLIQSPPSTDNDSSSPLNNGLLESILYESQCLKRSKKNYFTNQQYSDDGDDVAVVGGGLTSQLHDADWAEVYYSDSISPFGHSATSFFTEYTTPASGISSDDPVEIVPSKPAVEWDDPKQYGTNTDISDEMKKYSRPDLLLESSNWFGPDTKRGKDHSILTDAIGQLLGEDSFT